MRKLSNWITEYIIYTEKQESPAMFHKWCAISVIAASLERNCFLDYGYFKLYPNQYIILVGASASVRKSSAIIIADNLYKDALPESPVFSQKITAISLIMFLKEGYKKTGTAGGYVVAEELSVFLGNAIQDATLIQLLTKIYGCPQSMDYSTVSRGHEVANNTFCSMLGGTTPEWIKDSFPPHAIGGGFAGRILFIYQDKTDRKFIHRPLSEKRKQLRIDLINDLQEIHKIKGEFHLTKDASEWYEHWYLNVYNPDKSSTDLKGYFGRKHDYVLKLSMALSCARSSDMTISFDDITMALSLLEEVETTLPQTLSLIQSTMTGQYHQKIISLIRTTDNYRMARADLMRRMSYQMNARELDDLLSTLNQANLIKTEVDEKGVIWYCFNTKSGGDSI